MTLDVQGTQTVHTSGHEGRLGVPSALMNMDENKVLTRMDENGESRSGEGGSVQSTQAMVVSGTPAFMLATRTAREPRLVVCGFAECSSVTLYFFESPGSSVAG